MSEPYLGSIMMFGGNFAIRGWAFCNGQLLPISQNSALFSLLGTTYGGDGRTTFALPDMRGRKPMHWGNGPGLSDRHLGQKGGSETTTLTTNQMPSHNHTLRADELPGTSLSPQNNALAESNNNQMYNATATNVNMHSSSITNTGGGQSFNIEDPFLCVSFEIALIGLYPSRN